MRNSFDWTPYRRSTVGFDRLFDFLETERFGGENYPPFDIERMATIISASPSRSPASRARDRHRGAAEHADRQRRKAPAAEDEGRQLLYSGIATRAFERRFQLADFVRVERADLADGLLIIDLVREVPEAMKPHKIAIGGLDPAGDRGQEGGITRRPNPCPAGHHERGPESLPDPVFVIRARAS